MTKGADRSGLHEPIGTDAEARKLAFTPHSLRKNDHAFVCSVCGRSALRGCKVEEVTVGSYHLVCSDCVAKMFEALPTFGKGVTDSDFDEESHQ